MKCARFDGSRAALPAMRSESPPFFFQIERFMKFSPLRFVLLIWWMLFGIIPMEYAFKTILSVCHRIIPAPEDALDFAIPLVFMGCLFTFAYVWFMILTVTSRKPNQESAADQVYPRWGGPPKIKAVI